MLNIERQTALLEYIQNEHSVTVKELAGKFFVSEATIRRDLSALERKGLIKRSHGGAILLDGRDRESPLLMRESENPVAKEIIASLAVALIKEQSVLMMDSSSTVLRLIPLLARFDQLTVITHGLKTALLLHERTSAVVHCPGGRLIGNTFSLHGPHACERIQQLNADTAFISCRGFSLERGVMDASEDEAQIKRCMIESSKQTILLLDNSKLEQRYLIRVCDASSLSAIVCNMQLPASDVKRLSDLGVSVITP